MSNQEEKRRVYGVIAVFVIAFCILAGRLVYLSVQKPESQESSYDYEYIDDDGVNDADTINDEFLIDENDTAESRANSVGFTFDGGYGVKITEKQTSK
jgi:hypothetical protein